VTGEPRVVLLGRVGCHLCDEARAVVAAVCATLAVDWVEHDVDADPALRQRWSDFVPVVLVDGQEHARYRVEAGLLQRALR
jgi:glutaredoxin